MEGKSLTIGGALEIARLSPDAADEIQLTSAVAGLINDAYAVAEKGLWATGITRTTAEEIAVLTQARQVAVARAGGRIVGCVRVRQLDSGIEELGMLAVDPTFRSMGVGRELVRFAEQVARNERCDIMQLEVLVPCDRPYTSPEFLPEWYARLGYEPVGTAAVEEYYPEHAPFLAVPCYFVIYRKDLSR